MAKLGEETAALACQRQVLSLRAQQAADAAPENSRGAET
jgi:hypothetical protein